MTNVLVTGSLPDESRKRLEGLGLRLTVSGLNDLVEEKEFIKAINDKDIFISCGKEITTQSILDSANALKLIVFIGTDCGTSIDLACASRKGIAVCNTPGANALSVAEFTVGLILDAQRRISLSTSLVGNENYDTSSIAYGKTLGLIGFGNIGSTVAKICSSGLGMKISYWTRSGEKKEAKNMGAKFLELDDLLATSDIVSLHVPGASGCLLNATRIRKLKPGALLINTARANLCDPNALLEALSQDPQLYAAFDVFYDEVDKNNPLAEKLRRFIPDQLLVTPHVAWKTFEADLAAYEMALASISDFIKGLKPRNMVVNPAPIGSAK